MSLTTRCPACQTAFKVVPDQLRIAAGWVRCGQCHEVFDATAHMLLPGVAVARAAAPAVEAPDLPSDFGLTLLPEPEAEPVSQLDPVVPAAEEPRPNDPDTLNPPAQRVGIWSRFSELEHDLEVNPPTPLPGPDLETAELSALEPTLSSLPFEDAGEAEEMPALTTASETPTPIPAAPATPEPADVLHATPLAPPDNTAPSFVRQARRRAFWTTRPVRTGLWLSLGLLALLLAGQWAVLQRDELAARHPQLRPALTALCQPLRCSVQPHRQSDAIVIDGSGFHRIDAERFRFSMTLRNSTDWPVAMPAIELTLTDGSDTTLVRRVLRPQDLDAPVALGPRQEFEARRVLTLSSAARPQTIANYRLTAFYP